MPKIVAIGATSVVDVLDGNSVVETIVEYAVSLDGKIPPGNPMMDGSETITDMNGVVLTDGTWSTEIPTIPEGQWLWTRTRTFYSDGQFTIVYTVSRSGNNGTQGTPGVGYSSQKEQWYLSSSPIKLEGDSWSDNEPSEIPEGKYLWGRIEYTMSDGSTRYSDAIYRSMISGLISKADEVEKKIEQKIWASDIQTSIDSYDGSIGKSIKDTVVQTEATIGGINTTIQNIQSDVSKKADGTEVTNLSKQVNTISDTVDEHTQTISSNTSRLNNAEAEITSTKTIANQTADKFTWLVQSGDSASNFTLTSRVAELVTPQVVIKDPAGNSTVITGGNIQANTITAAMLATDAIKSSNYSQSENPNTSPYSGSGTFLDLANGNFWTPNFGVIQITPLGTNVPTGAWFNGTVYANAGRFGDGSAYFNIETFKDFNQNKYAGLVADGNAYIETGNWQVSNNSVATRKYITTTESAGQLTYYRNSETGIYYDVGMKIPTNFSSAVKNEAAYSIYNKSFFYGRKSKGNYIPVDDDGWDYLFQIDHDGNIYEQGQPLNARYAAIGDVEGQYVSTTGGTVNGNITVTGTLTATASQANQLTHALSINGVSFDGSGNSDVDVGTIGVAYGGTGKTSWTANRIVYASATNTLNQLGAGTSGQLLRSNGSAAPTWIDQSSIVAGNATNATNATNDANGDKIDTTYRKLSDTAFPNGLTGNVTGNVTGSAGSVKNNLIIKLNGGATEGTDLFTYNGSAKKTINITGASLGLSGASTHGVDTSISSGSTSSNLPTAEAVVNFVEGQNYGVLGVAEGSSDGKISVTTASGTSDVAVHGLGSWAYKSSGSASDVGLSNVTNNKQVKGLASGTTSGHLVSWGTDGYTVADSGVTAAAVKKTVTTLASNADGKIVLTYLDGTTSDPIEVKIIGQSGSSVSYADALNVNGQAIGSTSAPVYIDAQGKPQQTNTIPTIALNGSSTVSASFYAPIASGTSGQYLKSNGTGAPTWETFSKSTVGLGNVDDTADNIKNVLSATKFNNARSIALTGDTTGTASSDGTNGWNIATMTKQFTTLGRLTSADIQTNTTQSKKVTFAYSSSAMTTSKPTGGHGYILTFAWDNGGYASQFFLKHTKTPHAMIRGATSATIDGVENSSDWGDWIYLLDANNYNDYSPTLEGTGATGTWGISISGVAATATTAINDSDSNPINTTYAKLSGATFTGAVTGTTITANAIYAGGNSLTSNGIALYGTNCQRYGLAIRSTANRGAHGYVTGDKAEYFFMDDTNSGWIYNNYSDNVASISELGNAVFNGSVTVGGNSENNSGCELVMNNNLGCLDFVFN